MSEQENVQAAHEWLIRATRLRPIGSGELYQRAGNWLGTKVVS